MVSENLLAHLLEELLEVLPDTSQENPFQKRCMIELPKKEFLCGTDN